MPRYVISLTQHLPSQHPLHPPAPPATCSYALWSRAMLPANHAYHSADLHSDLHTRARCPCTQHIDAAGGTSHRAKHRRLARLAPRGGRVAASIGAVQQPPL